VEVVVSVDRLGGEHAPRLSPHRDHVLAEQVARDDFPHRRRRRDPQEAGEEVEGRDRHGDDHEDPLHRRTWPRRVLGRLVVHLGSGFSSTNMTAAYPAMRAHLAWPRHHRQHTGSRLLQRSSGSTERSQSLTASVLSPRVGGARSWLAGVDDSRIGLATVGMTRSPSPASATGSSPSDAARSTPCAIELIGAQGRPASVRVSNHSWFVFSLSASMSSGSSSSRWTLRSAKFAKRASAAHSGCPRISASRANWLSLPQAMMIWPSAVG